MLYGGAIDSCKLFGQDSHGSGEMFDKLVHIEDDNTTSSIFSPPFRMCPCVNHHPDCSKSPTKHFIMNIHVIPLLYQLLLLDKEMEHFLQLGLVTGYSLFPYSPILPTLGQKVVFHLIIEKPI